MTITNNSKKGKLLAQLNGGTNVTILGYVCWWSIHDVEIDQARFKQILATCGFKEKYAREHNYRSAFLRALKEMEEQRIIRLVKEDPSYLIYQFTAEDLVNDERFEYNPETVVTISKDKYRETKSMEAAMIKGDEEIKAKLLKLFLEKKGLFKSSDVSRVLGRIFADEADIVSLREQGSVYFIPGGYKTVLDRAVQYVGMLPGNCRLESLPIPDAPESRSTIKTAVTDEVEAFADLLEKEIAALEEGKTVTERYFKNKTKKLAEVRDRLELYSELLGDGKTGMEAKFASLERKLFATRELDI